MEDCLHTSSDNLAKLVKWAHSHGTICTLIPSLKHLLTEGAHGNLTALWGCSAGHAYHWPLTATCKTSQKERVCYPDSRSINAESLMQGTTGGSGSQRERFMDRSGGKGKSNCVQVGDSCDFSNCSEPSEADDNTEEYNSNLFDIVCESSATDEDGDSEPHQQQHAALRKRTAPGGGGGGGGGGGEHEAEERSGDPVLKKIKQETAEDYYTVANAQLAAGMLSEGGPSSTVVSQSPRPSSLTRPSSHSSLSHKLSSVDGDSLGVSPLPMGSSSSPHPQTMLRPMRAPTHTAQSKAPGQSSGAPAGALSLPSKSELLDRMPGDELAKSAVSYGDLGGGLNPELDLMTGQALNADSRAEASEMEDHSEAYREQNEKTIRSTQTAIRNFRDFLIAKYPVETREIYGIPPQELDAYLASFFVDARQKDGSEYEPNSLANYQCGLERYLKEQRYHYSITRDKEFRRSQEALKQKQLELKFKGKGNKPHKSMKLTVADELLLRKRGLLSRYNPEGLLNLVWLNNTKAFGHCTGFHSSALKWGDIRLITSESGLECLEWTYQDLSDVNAKTRRSGTECRIYATPQDAQKCPVQDYKEYAQRRPQAMFYEDAPFYLSIKPVVNLAALHWFNCQALGKNKLAKMVKTMCEKGNIPGRRTNFSVYQSCSSLSEAQSNQLVLICNNLSQQASHSMSGHAGGPTNFVIAGSFDPADSM
ncbi:uncharacterized protein KIAA1958 isoform X1 [Alosa alosa]|uniref:uncharacterized protein KIAA1958 isoform X1 n=1 Tax=Alosa alosa TaxID=278164 RepID=UPI00201548BB|nr:uncharacterized protein KIAA1958 isoform X1 [Alosa alosa]